MTIAGVQEEKIVYQYMQSMQLLYLSDLFGATVYVKHNNQNVRQHQKKKSLHLGILPSVQEILGYQSLNLHSFLF